MENNFFEETFEVFSKLPGALETLGKTCTSPEDNEALQVIEKILSLEAEYYIHKETEFALSIIKPDATEAEKSKVKRRLYENIFEWLDLGEIRRIIKENIGGGTCCTSL